MMAFRDCSSSLRRGPLPLSVTVEVDLGLPLVALRAKIAQGNQNPLCRDEKLESIPLAWDENACFWWGRLFRY